MEESNHQAQRRQRREQMAEDVKGRAGSLDLHATDADREACEIGKRVWEYVEWLEEEAKKGSESYQPDRVDYEVRREAVLEALGAVRGFGGKSLCLAPGSSQPEAEAVAEVVQGFFPTQWILASRRLSRLRVTGSSISSFIPLVVVSLVLIFLLVGVLILLLSLLMAVIGPGELVGALLVELLVLLVLFTLAAVYVYRKLVLPILRSRKGSPQGRYMPGYTFRERRLSADTLAVTGYMPPEHGAAHEVWRANVLHELCHHFEHVIPEIGMLEKRLLARRSGQAVRHWPWGLRSPGIALKHDKQNANFTIGYANHHYLNGRDYEILTTGYQGLMFGYKTSGGVREDPEEQHRNFVLGVLAALGPCDS